MTRRMARRCYAFLGFGICGQQFINHIMLYLNMNLYFSPGICSYMLQNALDIFIFPSFFCCIKKWREISVQNVVSRSQATAATWADDRKPGGDLQAWVYLKGRLPSPKTNSKFAPEKGWERKTSLAFLFRSKGRPHFQGRTCCQLGGSA